MERFSFSQQDLGNGFKLFLQLPVRETILYILNLFRDLKFIFSELKELKFLISLG